MIHWSNKHIKIHSLYKLSQLTEASPAITINNKCESLPWSQIHRLHFVLLILTTTLCTCSSCQSFLSWLWIYVTSKHWIFNWMYFRLLRSIMTLPFCNMARDSVLHWIVPYLCRHDMNCVLHVIHNYQDSYKLHLNKTLSDTTRDKPHNCQYSQWLWTGQPGYEAWKGQDFLSATTSRPEQPPIKHTWKAFSLMF